MLDRNQQRFRATAPSPERTWSAGKSSSSATAANLGAALDRLPMVAERLPHVAQPEIRALFDSLHLKLVYQPRAKAVDVRAEACSGRIAGPLPSICRGPVRAPGRIRTCDTRFRKVIRGV